MIDAGTGLLAVLMRYAWALPNSLIGLAFLPTALLWRGGAQIVDGVLEVHSGLVAWALRHLVPLPGGAAAITFGHVVLGRDARSLAMTRAHERVHVRQIQIWGPAFIPAYLLAALWAVLRGGGPYEGNFFEREALRRDRAGARVLADNSANQ